MRKLKLHLATIGIVYFSAMAAMAQRGVLPTAYAQRCTEQSRLACIAQHGGTPQVEAAVIRSLQWLAGQQGADGSWSAAGGHKCAMTGFAVQCFLGHGQAPDSAEYGATVSKALAFLITAAAANQDGMLSQKPHSAAATYEHAIATTALGEACVFERAGGAHTPGLAEAFVNAVKLIIAVQNKTGGWSYGGEESGYYKDGSRGDLSLSSWHFAALKIAKDTGLQLASLDNCITKAVRYIESTQTKDGGFGNINPETAYNQWALTGGATAGLQMLDPKKQKQTDKGIRFLREFLNQEPLDWQKNCHAYRLRNYTDAFFRAGGEDWKFYSGQLLPLVLAAQQADGKFVVGEKSQNGTPSYAVFNQALYTLQLQVFYRLPAAGR